MKYFGRDFLHLDDGFLEELRTLEMEGCIYSSFWREDLEKFAFCRIVLRPAEIVEYVEATAAFDEFNGLCQIHGDPDTALERLSNARIRNRVLDYNRWATSIGQDSQFCHAAFLGGELESLVCGCEDERYEFLRERYSGDRRYLLREVLDGLPESVHYLQNRRSGRPAFMIETEFDVQDLLFTIVKPIFPDAVLEDYTTKHAGLSKRIDIVLRAISTVVEVKAVRNLGHAQRVADELKIDIESYHSHPHCKSLVAVVWDERRHIHDRRAFEKDLSGWREKSGRRFQVEVHVLPR